MATGKKFRFTHSMTAEQARLVWAMLDGQLDAGSCKDGLTEDELDAGHRMAVALSNFHSLHEGKSVRSVR